MIKITENDVLLNGISQLLPVGTILPYIGNNPPNGFIVGMGQEVSRTDYNRLFVHFRDTVVELSDGTTTTLLQIFGDGDGSTTFNIPDLRETVLVGVGENTTDTIAEHDVYTLGQFKDDQFQGHYHNVQSDALTAGAGNYFQGSGWTTNATIKVLAPSSDGTNGTPRYGTTTHGKQIGVNYIIKY